MNLSSERMNTCSRVEKVKERERILICLLDLPELILENIFERLSPADLCSMALVCSSLWEMCTSDHLWEKNLKRKWGKLIDDAVYQEWQSHVASIRSRPNINISDQKNRKGLFEAISNERSHSRIRPKLEDSSKAIRTTLPIDSVMAFYVALENGKFWFPAQMYHGKTGYRGPMLLCYDVQVCHDSRTNTFHARYRYGSHGWGRTEANIEWDRLRARKVDSPPCTLHVSDCLNDLKPGDHIEIQWTSHKEHYPYDWWYAVIGHLESCDGNENHCLCHYSDTFVVEFNQYHPRTTWRRVTMNRRYHPEKRNGVYGFYGGIRKLCDAEEIAKWLSFRPNSVI